ncbi:MAG: metallophosphoesterase [Deltaproteobacteria bacterium]|nr:metallophosphoesterase [Deltaproteobacteria bacterium]
MNNQKVTDTNKDIKICHISDFHLPIEESFPPYKLLSKRIMGYANLKLLRSKNHQKEPFLRLLEKITEEKPDMLIATGDLVNLALETEYKNIADIFNSFGYTKDNLMLVPGNHDRYTPGAQRKNYFEKSFAKWLDCNGTPPCFPIFKDLGNIAIIGIDTAVWRGPVSAAGKINKVQLKEIENIIVEKCKGKKIVAAMHHPPYKLLDSHLKQYLSGLYGYKRVLELLKNRNALVLHGHIHVRTDLLINDTHIVGVPSASNNHGSHHKKMSFHTFNFDKNGDYKVYSTAYHAKEDQFKTDELLNGLEMLK